MYFVDFVCAKPVLVLLLPSRRDPWRLVVVVLLVVRIDRGLEWLEAFQLPASEIMMLVKCARLTHCSEAD